MEGLLWLLVFGAGFYLMMRFGCGAHRVHGHDHVSGAEHGAQGGAAGGRDPVCGMQVADDSGYTKAHEGTRYRFCSKSCLEKFEANPANYVTAAGRGRQS